MRSPQTKGGGKVELQPGGLYPAYCDYENTNPSLTGHYVDTFHDMYLSAVPTNAESYHVSLPSNIWPAEMMEAPDTFVTAPFGSPTRPTDYMAVPVSAPFIGVSPMTPNGTQNETDSLWYTSTRTPWWLASPSSAASSNSPMTTTVLASFEATIPGFQDPKAAKMTLANLATNMSQLEIPPGLRHDSSSRRTSISLATEPSEAATDFESGTLWPRISPARSTTSPRGPTASPGRRASSPTRASPGTRARRTSQRPPQPSTAAAAAAAAAARLKKRPRNRAAALKYRAKIKAAAEALEAAEKTESRRRERLLATSRALQADAHALKGEVLRHARCGDALIEEYLGGAARRGPLCPAPAATAAAAAKVAGPSLPREAAGAGWASVSPPL